MKAGLIKAIDGIGRGFDYSTLPADVAGDAQRIAIMVRSRHKEQIKAVVETGRDLAAVKAKLAHGQFTPWLEAEFGWSERTAQNYMAAAAAFEGKTAIVADLPLTTVYALSAPSTPEPVRAEIVQRIEGGERLGDGEIRGILQDAARLRKQAAADAKKTPEARKREKAKEQRRQADRERVNAQLAEVAAARNLATERAAMLILQAFGDGVEDLLRLLDEGEYHEGIARAVRLARGDFK